VLTNATNVAIHLIGVPYDSGAKNARMGRGPGHLVDRGLPERIQRLGVPVQCSWIELKETFPTEIATTFAVNRLIAERVRATGPNSFPLVLSGNCNSCVGVVGGLAEANLGVVWFDGHGDFNTPETTVSGFLDGMGLAMTTGRCWRGLTHRIPGFTAIPDENVVLVGARDFDGGEADALKNSGIAQVDVRSIQSVGSARVLTRSLKVLRDRVSAVYLHLDLDVLDPPEARANQLAPADGLSVQELVEATRTVAQCLPVRAATVAAYDPECDKSGSAAAAAIAVVEALVCELRE
jgi:arginase